MAHSDRHLVLGTARSPATGTTRTNIFLVLSGRMGNQRRRTACGITACRYGGDMRAVHWFRNDLRLRDNPALAVAAVRATELVPVFVLDDLLLAGARSSPLRVRFLLDCLARLAADLQQRGCPLVIRRGDPALEVPRLLAETKAELLTFNRDYSPYAVRGDSRVRRSARALGALVEDCKDRVVFEAGELRTRAGSGFRVYTPFRSAWLERHRREPPALLRVVRLPRPVAGIAGAPCPSLAELIGSDERSEIARGGEAAAQRRLATFLGDAVRRYARDRDRPGVDGTSRLSPYLRFGAISVRQCVHDALAVARREPSA